MTAARKSKEAVFEVYSTGICFMSVCTDLPVEEVAQFANLTRPTGIKSKWTVAKEAFHTGQTNPCPCDQHPLTQIHILLEC